MLYLLIAVATVVVGALAWAWWRDRAGRDPVSSIESFHRALDAMQPGSRSEPTDGGFQGEFQLGEERART